MSSRPETYNARSSAMQPNADIDIWSALFEQTPRIVRWILGFLTLGIFTLLSVLYRWHRDDMRRVHERVDQLENRLDDRLDEVNRHLIQIAANTSRK